ncbi:serine hydrolase domain-containing protein [Taibaiella koreensis]|uniref:serine hydrolase domain-containing protein n=1 Tax=Taibaiella koreensis TaxID=1268548 RepID=UPI000E5A033A|nr:serine hydrolase domain-containing protein [Taibaiella koreensis]
MRLLSLLCLLLAASCVVPAQEAGYAHAIDSLVAASSNPRPFSGVILIRQKGKTVLSRAYGMADSSTGTVLKPEDQFAILSNTKQMTAVLVLQEVEKGHIDLHTPIRKYLPGLEQGWADTVTVDQLLNHTGGVVMPDRPLAFRPGTQFQYSNAGYALLAQITERTSGRSYATQIRTLFKKYGLKHSLFPDSSNQQNLVRGYRHRTDGSVTPVKGIVFSREQVPFGGMIATAGDLALWNELLHNGKLLRPETYTQMVHYHIKNRHPVFGEREIGYGYGLRINDEGAVKEYGHTGYAAEQGFTAVNLYYPASGTSVVILENQAYDNFDIAYYYEAAIRHIVLASLGY